MILFDDSETGKILKRFISDILNARLDFEIVSIIGIKEGGTPFVDIIRDAVKERFNCLCNTGYMDMTLYRDDPFNIKKSIKGTELPFDINGKIIILVDDVIMSGRTVRAAMDQIFDFGRPKSIKLAVFIDKGERELPICPDFIGKKIEPGKGEIIHVDVVSREKSVRKIIKN